jgi:hypothetical protein
MRSGGERDGHGGCDGWCEQHRGDEYRSDCVYNRECGEWEWGDHEYGVDNAAEWNEWRCSCGAGWCWVNDCHIGWLNVYALVSSGCSHSKAI